MSKVSIVILNWNRYQDTHECIKSLQKINTKDLEVDLLVVDNDSTDGSFEKLQHIKLSPKSLPVAIIRNKANLGFAEGNNVGIRIALKNNADYILILNNDTIVEKDFLQELIAVAKDKPNAGAISSKIYFAKGFEFHKDRYTKKELGRVLWYAGGLIDWNNVYGTNHGADEVDLGQHNRIHETDFATGACVLLSAQALRKVGIFDSNYFMYLEDADLCMRLKKKKFTVLFAPKSIIWHKVAQSSGIGSNLNDYFITRNRLIFGFKYARLRTKIALMREGIKFIIKGRFWQRIGVLDFMIGNLGKGSWK